MAAIFALDFYFQNSPKIGISGNKGIREIDTIFILHIHVYIHNGNACKLCSDSHKYLTFGRYFSHLHP